MAPAPAATATAETVRGVEIPDQPDIDRMRRERTERVRAGMAGAGIDALVLLSNANVSYATGTTWPLSDAGRGNVERPVAVVLADDETPHLFTPFVDDAAADLDLDADHLHGPTYLDAGEGVTVFARQLAELTSGGATIAYDEVTGAMHHARDALFASWPPLAASKVMNGVRMVKTPDELACLRGAMRIAEAAMAEIQATLTPGARQTDLTATFLRRVFELGADANVLDTIWQVMPRHQADLPWTVHGDIACPLLTTERQLAQGDVLWVDASLSYLGYHSDFGRTWIVGDEPSARQQAQYQQWRAIDDTVRAVLRPGARATELTTAAMDVCDGERPWLAHFYLGHGIGLDSAESPYVGTDLGVSYDDRLVFEPGTVVVVEPIVWDEGHSGYRSENILAVTDDGHVNLSDYPYAPYGD
jgi:Xaa-Pro dipeptidase